MKARQSGSRGRRKRAPGPEAVVAFFNRGRTVTGVLLRENEQLRSRIRRLEGELRRAAVKDSPGGDQGAN